jgi:CheY-like chemotaxis protein
MPSKKPTTKKNPTKKIAPRILIAEDEQAICAVLVHQFTQCGFTVMSVDNGRDAFHALQSRPFDVAMIDILMPKMDGLEVLKAIKKDPRASTVPMFVFSNLAQEMDVATVKKFGIIEYVVKADVSIEDVVQKITRFLKKKR